MGTLAEVYTKHGTDKGETGHHYGNFYESYFEQFKGKAGLTVLELGVWTGNSVAAHDEYFETADIWAVDIDLSRCGNRFHGKPNIHLVQRDSNDINYFKELFGDLKFDIILDDASHLAKDQMNNLYNFRQFLKKDGIYVLEDLHCNFDLSFSKCTYDDSPLRFLIDQHKVSYFDDWKQEELLKDIKEVYTFTRMKDRNCLRIYDQRSVSSIILFK